MKMMPEAVKEYEQAIAIRPDLPGLHLELGEIYAGRAEWPKAEEQFRAETKLQPGSAEAAFRLGEALMQEGKMKEAAGELRRSDSLHPNMPETLYAMGRALATADANAAEQALTSVLKLEQNSSLAAQADLLLASIHRKQGKSALAEPRNGGLSSNPRLEGPVNSSLVASVAALITHRQPRSLLTPKRFNGVLSSMWRYS